MMPASHIVAGPFDTPAELALMKQDIATHHLSDRIVTLPGADRRFRVFMAVPRQPAPPEGWPVVYFLDGNAVFDRMQADDLAGVPGLVVVGIGYDTDLPFDTAARALDYTPPLSPLGPVADPTRPGRMAGGADRFLPLLTGDLRAEVERDLPIDPSRRSLWGHSYGGLFVLYAWFTAPDSFAGYASVSPSLWWGDGVMARLEAAHPVPADRPLLLAYGDRERRRNDPRPPDGPPKPTVGFGQRMSGKGGDVTGHVIAGASHGEALTRSIPLVMRWAAGLE